MTASSADLDEMNADKYKFDDGSSFETIGMVEYLSILGNTDSASQVS